MTGTLFYKKCARGNFYAPFAQWRSPNASLPYLVTEQSFESISYAKHAISLCERQAHKGTRLFNRINCNRSFMFNYRTYLITEQSFESISYAQHAVSLCERQAHERTRRCVHSTRGCAYVANGQFEGQLWIKGENMDIY